MTTAITCPRCIATKVTIRNYARTTGSAVGTVAGAAVGEHIDDTVLDNYECEECGHIFGKRHIL